MIGKWPYPHGDYPANWFNFFPGFYLQLNNNSSTAAFDSVWEQVLSGGRKNTWRPPGIFCGLVFRLYLRFLYTNPGVRPTDPTNWQDAGYSWANFSKPFLTNAVQYEGGKVILQAPGMVTPNAMLPEWLQVAPYNAQFIDTVNENSKTPKFNRFVGPDIRGVTNSYASQGPAIVEEMVKVHQAVIGYVTAMGWLDKIALAGMGGEIALQSFPDGDRDSFIHGYRLFQRKIAKLWNDVGINGCASTLLNGSAKDVAWPYIVGDAANANAEFRKPVFIGMGFPDVKEPIIGTLIGATRFQDPEGVHQKDIRPLFEGDETNGLRATSTFPAGLANPWGYSNVTVPQTASHKIWSFSGAPRGPSKDSALGQVGEDPSGPFPIHYYAMNVASNFQNLSYFPTIPEYQQAGDTFGPPGTGAFPYLPPGYLNAAPAADFIPGQVRETSSGAVVDLNDSQSTEVEFVNRFVGDAPPAPPTLNLGVSGRYFVEITA